MEADVEQHLLAGFIGEADVFESDFAADGPERDGAARVAVFGVLHQDFVRAVESGQRLGDLRADADDSENRRDQERQERGEGDESAERECAREDLARADEHDHCAHDPHQHGRREAHERHGGERGFDVRRAAA